MMTSTEGQQRRDARVCVVLEAPHDRRGRRACRVLWQAEGCHEAVRRRQRVPHERGRPHGVSPVAVPLLVEQVQLPAQLIAALVVLAPLRVALLLPRRRPSLAVEPQHLLRSGVRPELARAAAAAAALCPSASAAALALGPAGCSKAPSSGPSGTAVRTGGGRRGRIPPCSAPRCSPPKRAPAAWRQASTRAPPACCCSAPATQQQPLRRRAAAAAAAGGPRPRRAPARASAAAPAPPPARRRVHRGDVLAARGLGRAHQGRAGGGRRLAHEAARGGRQQLRAEHARLRSAYCCSSACRSRASAG